MTAVTTPTDRLPGNRRYPTKVLFVGTAAIIAGCAVVAIFCLRGFAQNDFGWIYVAGKCWLHARNPYDYTNVFLPAADGILTRPNAFAYAPQIAPFCIALAIGSYTFGKSVMLIVNLVSLLCLSLGIAVMSMRPIETDRSPAGLVDACVAGALMLACPFSLIVLGMGQSSLAAAAAVMWGWYCIYRDRPFVGGLLLAIGAMKPTFAILPALWLCLDRRWTALASSFICGAVLALPAIIVAGPGNLIRFYILSLHQYRTVPYNEIGNMHVVGLRNLLHTVGVDAPSLIILALLVTVGLYLLCRRWPRTEILAMLVLIYALLGFSHDYDFVMFAPLLIALALWAHGNLYRWCAALFVIGCFEVPQHFVHRIFGDSVVLEWRTFIVMLYMAWIAIGTARRSRCPGPVNDDALVA